MAGVNVWIPEGRYTDIFTGRIYCGKRFVKMYRDIENFPVLAKEGAIIPMSANDRDNDCSNPAELELLVYRGNNTFTLYDSNSVSPTVAGTFFIKSLVAVAIAAGFIILYVSIRFRKIGGFTAAVCSVVALVHDVIIAFLACVIFGLEIDTNFFAVVLTLFGYSLNSTIVMFDRIRENNKHFAQLAICENVNKSLRETFTRSVFTAFTTFIAITSIAVVAEFFGVSALRSFAIPMLCGIVAGTFSSLFIAGPMWVKWSEARAAKESK